MAKLDRLDELSTLYALLGKKIRVFDGDKEILEDTLTMVRHQKYHETLKEKILIVVNRSQGIELTKSHRVVAVE